RGDRCHSGRGRARGGRAFERHHALLEHGDGRVGEARILIAGLLVLEALFRAERGLVDVALREIKRLAGLRELRAQDTGMHELGFGAIASLGGHGHRGSPQSNKKTRPEKLRRVPCPRPFSYLFYVAASRPAQMTTGITRL